jgi:hypothetical protein
VNCLSKFVADDLDWHRSEFTKFIWRIAARHCAMG